MTTPSALVESLDVPSLARKLLPGWTPSAPQVTLSDIQYTLKGPEGKQDVYLGVAALESQNEAKHVFDRHTMMVSIGPRISDTSIGDHVRIWGSGPGKGGPVLFRRDNVFVDLSSDMPFDELLAVARKLDSLIVAGDPAIRRAASLAMPKVELVDPPASFSPGEGAEIGLRIGSLQPAQALLGANVTHVVTHPGVAPSITYYAPREPGEDTVTLLVASPGNLLTRKPFTLRVR